TAAVTEDTALTDSGNVLTDNDGSGVDSDPNADTLTVSAVNGAAGNVGAPVAGTFGSVTVAANGAYTYTLNNALPAVQALKAGQTVTDVFNYTASDGHGGTGSATLTVTINGTNDAPTATNNTASVTEDTALTDSGNVLTDNDGFGTDSDPDGDPLAV